MDVAVDHHMVYYSSGRKGMKYWHHLLVSSQNRAVHIVCKRGEEQLVGVL